MKRISLVLAACALATACSPQAEEPAVATPEAVSYTHLTLPTNREV